MAFIKDKIYDWHIYKITNPNGRVYVGLTSNLERRMLAYKRGAHPSQRLIYRSIKKYEYNKHMIDILERFTSDKTVAYNKEMFWVRSYMSNFNKFPEIKGMNLTNGGDGIHGFKMSVEQIERHRKAQTGKKLTEEHKLKLSAALKGIKLGAISEERRAILKKAHTGKKLSKEHKLSLSKALKGKPQNHTYTPEKLKAMADRQRGHTSTEAQLKALALGRGIYHPRPYTEEHRSKLRELMVGNKYAVGFQRTADQMNNFIKKVRKRVQVFDLNDVFIKEYDSVISCANDLDISQNRIADFIKGRVKNPRQYKFKFIK